MKFVIWLAVGVSVAFWLGADTAWSQTKTWIAGNGNWNTPGNWSPSGVPGAGNTVNITPSDGAARVITYDYPGPPVNLGALTIDLTGPGNNRVDFLISGGQLTPTGFIVGSSGRATVYHTGGTVTGSAPTLDSVVGFNNGSDGIYSLSGTGSVVVNRDLYVGTLAGSVGTFFQSGGSNSIQSRLILGSANGAVGNYVISGGTLTAQSQILVGNLGTGALVIQPGGSVWTNDLSINSSSSVNLSGGTLRFDTATGLNRVTFNSGTIRLAGNRVMEFDDAVTTLFPGRVISANKQLIIEGTSTLSNVFTADGGKLEVLGSQFRVGDTGWGLGSLAVINGGSVIVGNSAQTRVGSSFGAGADGAVSVSGPNSFFNTGELLLGSNSGGSLTINAGGKVQTTSALLGGISSNVGTATVTGPGSSWTIASDLTIGGAGGTSSVTIANQGLVHVGNHISIHNATGSINLNGGTLRFNSIANINRLNYHSGTIQLAGNRDIGTDAVISSLYGGLAAIPTGKGLTVEGSSTLSSVLSISGGTFKTQGLTMATGGILDFNRGVFEITGGNINGLSHLVIPTSGEFRALGNHALRITGATGSILTATGNLTVGNAGLVNGFYTNGTVNVGSHLLTLHDANDAVLDAGSHVLLGQGGSPGTLIAANGLTLNFGGNITGHGTINTPNDPLQRFMHNGHIAGDSLTEMITLTGFIKGVGTLDNVQITGTYSPGFSPALISMGSALYDGTLVMELGGLAPGTGYDQVNHILGDGLAYLGGALDVQLLGTFTPSLGDNFQLLTAIGGVHGQFDSLSLPALGNSQWRWHLDYGSQSVNLMVTAIPESSGALGCLIILAALMEPRRSIRNAIASK